MNSLTLQIIGFFWSCSLNWSSKVAEFIHDEFEKRPFDFDVMTFWNWVLTFLLILIGYFIWSSALLCCFEVVMYWWRNWWVELCWYKMFLCGFEVFECFEELFFVDALFDVLMLTPAWKSVNLLMFSDFPSDFGNLMFDVSSYNKWLTNLLNSSELVDIVLC